VTLLIRYVGGYLDGVLLSKSSKFGLSKIYQCLSTFQKNVAGPPSQGIG
jgi:hypothetical protein